MTKDSFKKIKDAVFSLRMRFLLVFFLAVTLGVGLYFLCTYISTDYINNVYMSRENKISREEGYLTDLQNFINANQISSSEKEAIYDWAKENEYVYLLVYKGDQIFFTSDEIVDETPDDPNAEEPGTDAPGDEADIPEEPDGESGENGDDEGKGENGEEEEENPGFTIRYPTREELFEYAQANDMHPITTKDGEQLYVHFAEFTEYLYHDISNIISIILAGLTVAIFMIVYIQKMTSRILRLGNDVKVIAAGEIEHKIKTNGKDEIAELSENVDEMRNSLVETVKKEREAMESNTALITSMSHDIRTPLTVLLGYIDVMRSHSEGDEEMQNYINAAESTALRLKKLSDDMFGYFLVFGGKDVGAEILPYDAATLLDQMLAEHVLLLRENGYTIDVSDEDCQAAAYATVNTDAKKLVRIFDNIFSNIYKYADKQKPIKITVSGDSCEISLMFSNTVRTDGEQVESNGIGLKTCERLAEIVGAKFEHGSYDGEYFVKLTLQIAPRENNLIDSPEPNETVQ